MRLLFIMRALEASGGHINAMNLMQALRRRGHLTAVMADDGALTPQVRARGIPWLRVPHQARVHPHPGEMVELQRALRRWRIDAMVAIETQPGVMLQHYAVALATGVPLLQTYFGNWISGHYWPRSWPVVVNKPYMVDEFKDIGWPPDLLHLWMARIEAQPPVAPAESARFARRHQLPGEAFLALCVGRLDRFRNYHYLDFIFRAAALEDDRGDRRPVCFVIVGGGPAREEFRARARAINDARAATRIILTGEEPQADLVYPLGDVHLGRASALLRAMAHRRPCVAVGNNYFAPVDAAHLGELIYYEFTRNLPADAGAPRRLLTLLRELRDDPVRRGALGDFAQGVIREHFDLARGVVEFESLLLRLVRRPPRGRPAQLGELTRLALDELGRRLGRRLGRKPRDRPSRQGLPFEVY